jgi:hypothetical protein
MLKAWGRDGGVLTHTKCALGVQLKALRAANFILLCKAKRMALRTRGYQSPGHLGHGPGSLLQLE